MYFSKCISHNVFLLITLIKCLKGHKSLRMLKVAYRALWGELKIATFEVMWGGLSENLKYRVIQKGWQNKKYKILLYCG